MKIKVGSLFDGIGGAPLAAIMSGAEPVWASEIEKVPVSITERHFPNMKHYGDVTQINGAELEPVDVIIGGSPCQDLSIAGGRAGLEGERSGLFMDQVRIVKEMRNATRRETEDGTDELPRPRYMVWENVPGTFSSNKGEDFRAVLEEVCRIGEGEVSIPRPPKGKWSKSGTILGDGYSVAWRIVDAQHWGVAQRRRRVYLVADFGGHTAPEICFERESLSRDIAEGGEAGQGIAEDAERSSGAAGELALSDQGGIDVVEPICFEPRSQDGVHRIHGDISPTLNTAQGGQRQPCVLSAAVSPEQKYIVRRLTPLECERLQGFPDGWTAEDVNGKTVSDTQRYKALGNSFAMPNAYFFISRVIRELRKGNHEP